MSSCVRFISNTTSTKHFDVIVSGGGMIGTALSCLLAQTPSLSSHKILLLESNKPKQWSLSPAYSNRVSSVNEATKHLMESIGAWEHISKARFKPVMNMKVWDCSGAKVEFNNDNSPDPVAYIVENDILVDSVEKELKKADNVTVMNDTRVEEYTLPKHGDEEVQLRLTDGSTVTCNLLVGADGANSAVRKAMGVQYVSWKYNQTAVVATLKLAEEKNKDEQVNLKSQLTKACPARTEVFCHFVQPYNHTIYILVPQGSQNDTAWQRFLHSGPVALLPLTNELTSLVWSTSSEEAKRLLKLPNDSFVDALNDALWKEPVRSEVVTAVSSVARRVLGLVESTAPSSSPQPPNVASVVDSSRAAFPLAFGHAASYVAQAVALVGDAAHKVHPLAGQGVNLGYGDIKCLVDQLDQAAHLGKPLGHIGTLREYERLRQAHNLPLMMAIDLMARVYSTTNPVLLAAGNVALQVADSLSPIKTMMRNRAAS